MPPKAPNLMPVDSAYFIHTNRAGLEVDQAVYVQTRDREFVGRVTLIWLGIEEACDVAAGGERYTIHPTLDLIVPLC